jgi:hypothetical protein
MYMNVYMYVTLHVCNTGCLKRVGGGEREENE